MGKFVSLGFLILLSAFVYRDWFTFKVFSYGDYVYYTRDTLLSLSPFSVWVGNFGLGSFDLAFWRLPQYVVYVWGAGNGLEFNGIDRFLVFWPWIFLSVVSIYLFLSHYKLNERAKLIGSLIFVFNTYFLSISTQGHLLISIASCFSILTLLFFIKLLEGKKIFYIPLVSIFLSFTTFFDLRFWYITSALLFLYLMFKIWVSKKKALEIFNHILVIVWIYLIYVGLNVFWILPTLRSGGAIGGVLNRTLFGNEFLNIHYSYALFHPFWTGQQPAWFEIQDIFLLSWILPVFALCGFILGKRKIYIVFFGLLAVIGVFLTKQASIPFSDVYEWLFQNLPGFGAFREASKFYYLVALSYSVLIAYFIQYLSESGKRYSRLALWGTIGMIVVLLVWNVKPVITKEIGSLFIERHIPKDYELFNSYIKKENEYFRIAWFPRPTKWHNATITNPQLSIMDTLYSDWIDHRPKSTVDKYDKGLATEADIGIDFLKSDIGRNLLSSVSVKYIVLPISDPQNSDDSYPFYGLSQKEVYNAIKGIPYLKEISIGTGRLRVFEIESYNPHFYLLNSKNLLSENADVVKAESKIISSSDYEVGLTELRDPIYLIFSEKYNSQWALYLNEQDRSPVFRKGRKSEIRSQTTDISLNAFYVDPSKICHEDKNYCIKNKNGTYSFTARVFFKPQKGFELGSVLSIVFWVGSSILATVLFIYRRRKHEKK